jgi:hypothetical protein
VILELEGSLDEIDRGLAWVAELGVDISPLDGDILVG